MPIDAEQVVNDLWNLGVRFGDIIVLHSSYKATGRAAGSPEGFIEAILQAIGPQGTLLAPNLNIPGEFSPANPPRWDLKGGYIADKLGVVAQVFKDKYATDFSIHPTHSMMGRGPAAAQILAGHEIAGLPCGPGTPWEKYVLLGGRTLLVGVTQKNNTTYHCAEECIPDSYRLGEPTDGVVLVDGKEIPVTSRLHRWGNEADFDILNDELEQNGWLTRGKIGLADSLLIAAREFLGLAGEKLRSNPWYFLANGRLDGAGANASQDEPAA